MQINLTEAQLQEIQDSAVRDLEERLKMDLYEEYRERILNDIVDNRLSFDIVTTVVDKIKTRCIAELEEEVYKIVKKEMAKKTKLACITKKSIKEYSDEYFYNELDKLLHGYRIDVKINKKEKTK